MAGLRVLVVDDEEELVSALAERLSLRGFTVTGVTTGVAALARLADTSFDVVLVDVKMPGLDGVELVRTMRSRQLRVAVVLLTGHSSLPDAEKSAALGVHDYLLKPVAIDELVRVLRAAVERSQVEP